MKKIPTLFKRVFENGKIVDILPEITEGCEEAFYNGLATIKVDGACCAIINGELYKRYDAKNGKPIPEGAIKCQDSADPITGHLPCWIKCDRNNPADKWFWKAYDNSLPHFKVTNTIEVQHNLPDGTYEAIGPHFQSNPYKLECELLYRHGSELVCVQRDFESIKESLKNMNEEGIVFWLNDQPVCKIKRTDFGFEWNNRK